MVDDVSTAAVAASVEMPDAEAKAGDGGPLLETVAAHPPPGLTDGICSCIEDICVGGGKKADVGKDAFGVKVSDSSAVEGITDATAIAVAELDDPSGKRICCNTKRYVQSVA